MKTSIKTYHPFNGNHLETYTMDSESKLKEKLELADSTFKTWKQLEIKTRVALMQNLANELHQNKTELSLLITKEMGKPIAESRAEIEKCIYLIDFYIQNSDHFLQDDIIATEAHESFISYDPLGCILAVMPWNYPFWQVFRFAVPTLAAGNVALLKHASNVTGCAIAIEKLFLDAKFPKGCFQTLVTDHEGIEKLMSNDIVKAVSLTGSEKAGRKIAELAGKNLKPSLLELGGNNACIVLKDADLDRHIETIVKARMQNSGQSCIAAKRFIVVEDIYDDFIEKFTSKVIALNYGNPLEDDTTISCLAREDLAETLEKQVQKSIDLGAKVTLGNKRDGAYFQPTILTNVTAEMPVFKEETFGPVAAIIKVQSEDEAYIMASKSKFGLGTMVFTSDYDAALQRTSEIEDGAFFINEMVKSDPRLPFGGTKISGYGRELSKEGMLAFVNRKTVYINK
ncbi:NAD-dependent succinate-semialdehyde dehydrogenase [Winogradskyella psychrotolerans]|uniref:NAD-dependent succinate-semialdehyde dehydrogenase n=1 Tax=Winogradskyella psychrotolerans TaxID=1344585 RepID=UPI001C078CA5|nr:NAD-dependent succinate-semialdehyde dehydrogenase [Winogradskyella psychrotolerans]MBU2919888.1 NAD-dependent succinate-semialdehyde dehydrogenase [Winogradskyella psychrotolerans]|eukprot:TRINITY_DN2379_c0_g1_i1.p1 TRINITY_DN2379_c0_g1~~TRINITY_DN2379_c0_g1_i1.p1  ORF type:complete len:455 (+),score=104.96 TRINITY_DN2379_c0_g1_i1:1276-2640(+)